MEMVHQFYGCDYCQIYEPLTKGLEICTLIVWLINRILVYISFTFILATCCAVIWMNPIEMESISVCLLETNEVELLNWRLGSLGQHSDIQWLASLQSNCIVFNEMSQYLHYFEKEDSELLSLFAIFPCLLLFFLLFIYVFFKNKNVRLTACWRCLLYSWHNNAFPVLCVHTEGDPESRSDSRCL